MRVLVLGGNRYIGLNLVHELARRGHEVTVTNSHEAALPEGARRLHVDRRIPGELTRVLSPLRDDFDVVFDNTAYQPEDLALVFPTFSGVGLVLCGGLLCDVVGVGFDRWPVPD